MTGLTAATDKVVFTHVGALRAKYGSTGVSRLRAALRTMISNDRGRGVVSTVVDVSSAAALRPVGEPRIADPGDHDRFRRVLDAVCTLAEPDYVLLYGGPDIVPLVPLVNPMPAPDPDPDLPSDLPYAVPGGLTGLDPTALVGPTRVVGRLPDTMSVGGLDGAAAYARLTRSTARWRSADRAALGDPLCLSTARWQLSTAASAAAVLGPGATLRLAPPVTGPWAGPGLDTRLHLVNLHGATADPHWTGDPGFAPAVATADLTGRRLPGTVAVTESCFGAELWDPALALGALPLPLAYLAAGAYAVVGPTCLSYGGRTAPDAADVLCWLVVEEVLAGASLGRALLTARQRYVAAQPAMTPVDLKTLAQFSLLGDPSIHLVTPPPGAPVGARIDRRRRLAFAGIRLQRDTTVLSAAAVQLTVRRRRTRTGPAQLRVTEVTGPVPGRELESR